jgi:hypothetical protein
MSKIVHLQSRQSGQVEHYTKINSNSQYIPPVNGVHEGVLFEEVLDYIAKMTHDLRTIARRHDRTLLADLLLVAGEEARAQSRTASARTAPISS